MNRHPPQPPHARLDAEERALAELLPRPPGRSEPSAAMDARILAAGKADTQPQPARRQPRRNWIAPLSVAASLVLAVGLAWQLRPPPAPVVHEQAADAAFPAPDADHGGEARRVDEGPCRASRQAGKFASHSSAKTECEPGRCRFRRVPARSTACPACAGRSWRGGRGTGRGPASHRVCARRRTGNGQGARQHTTSRKQRIIGEYRHAVGKHGAAGSDRRRHPR